MRNRSLFIIFFFCFFSPLTTVYCQPFTTGISRFDSAFNAEKELKITDIINRVKLAHPVLSKAKLSESIGKYTVLEKKGQFDPKISVDQFSKNYLDKNYYELQSFELKMPTASPITPEIGFEKNTGENINPEWKTEGSGLSYVGINIDLLKGLITDSRRTQYQQSKIFAQQSILEKRVTQLDVASDIWHDYIDWFIAYSQKEAYDYGVNLSSQRQEALRSLFIAGGCNGMDTLENHIQLELFRTSENEWSANTFKQRLNMSRHLWLGEGTKDKKELFIPITIKPNIIPSDAGLSILDSLFQQAIKFTADQILAIPDLKYYELEMNQLALEVRLKKYATLPSLNLKIQTLNPGFDYGNVDFSNNRLGITFASPLFLRTERGQYLKTNAKFKQYSYSYSFKKHELQLKTEALKRQSEVYRKVYLMLINVENGYRDLYNMERDKFDNGDGSIFLLNTRENRYLTAKIKRIEQHSKYLKSVVEYLRAIGEIDKTIIP